jgi:hypothetical protein
MSDVEKYYSDTFIKFTISNSHPTFGKFLTFQKFSGKTAQRQNLVEYTLRQSPFKTTLRLNTGIGIFGKAPDKSINNVMRDLWQHEQGNHNR